jgi:hypothetical protein
MSLTVVVQETALRALARIRADPARAKQVWRGRRAFGNSWLNRYFASFASFLPTGWEGH